MKKMMNKVIHKANMLAIGKNGATNNHAEGCGYGNQDFDGVVMALWCWQGWYLLFDQTVLPTLTPAH